MRKEIITVPSTGTIETPKIFRDFYAIQESFESKLGYKRGIGVKEQLIKKILDVGKRTFERLTRKCHVDDHA
jgi:hypothetical protein